MSDIPSSRDLLIYLAVSTYNAQYGTNFDPKGFDIFSIYLDDNEDRRLKASYEIYTSRFDDYLRIHIHCTRGMNAFIGRYDVEVDLPAIHLALGDEVYVTYATLDDSFFMTPAGMPMMEFPVYSPDVSVLDIIISEQGGFPLLTEDGRYILLESGV